MKNQIDNISGSTFWNVIKFVFLVYPSRGRPKYIKTTVPTPCFYFKLFLKKKKSSGTNLLSHFFKIYEGEYLSRYILLTDKILLPGYL